MVKRRRLRRAVTLWLAAATASLAVALLSGLGVLFPGDLVKRSLIAATWIAVGVSFVGRCFSITKAAKSAERNADGEKRL